MTSTTITPWILLYKSLLNSVLNICTHVFTATAPPNEWPKIIILMILKMIIKIKKEFINVNEAISYMASTQIRNLQSCRISIPPLLKQIKNTKGKKVYTWKTDLIKTEKFWDDWYKDLSKQFLGIKIPKALILTDTNELDTPLTVGHMQGKFKLVVIKGTGHFVMEDDPAAVMEQINVFCQVFRIPRLVEDIKLIKSELGDQTKVVKYSE